MGYWGESGTTVTWKNPTITPESQRQSGGWYYNPGTGRVDRWWTGSQPTTPSTPSGGGGGGGGAGTDYQAIADRALAEQRAKEDAARKAQEEARAKEVAYLGQAKTEEQGLLGRYTSAIQNLEPLTAIRQRLGQEFNLPSLQDAANFLTQTLQNVPQAVKTLASQFGISAPRQEQRMQTLAANIAPAQQQAAGQAQTAQANVADMLKYEVQQQENQLLPFSQEFTMLKDRIAREAAGFSAENKAQLDVLLQELNTSGTLTSQQLQTARDLAIAEETYNTEKMKLDNATSTVTADGRIKLINTQTGEVIADLGSAKTGTGTGTTDVSSLIDDYIANQANAAASSATLKTVGSNSSTSGGILNLPKNYSEMNYSFYNPTSSSYTPTPKLYSGG